MSYFTKAIVSTVLMAGGITLAHPAQAHHAFSATFKSDATTTIEGTVTNYSFRNPHVLLDVEVENEDGTTTRWVAEGIAATFLRRSGWSTDSLKAGEYVRVTGSSTHDGSPMVVLDSIDVLDPNSKNTLRTLNPSEEQPSEANADRSDFSRRESERYEFSKILVGGRPNVSASWVKSTGESGDPSYDKMTAAGEKKQESFVLAEDPQVFCDLPGLVRLAGNTPHPYTITLLDDRIIISYEEYGDKREIPIGASRADLIDSGIKSRLGDSIAYYEDDVLVIETINLIENYSTYGGAAISDQATVVETFSRADTQENGAVLNYKMVVNDPLYYSEPLVFTRLKTAVEGYEMVENNCQPPLRDRTIAHTQTSFFLTSTGLGDGANLGGLAGADAHCEALAQSVGVGDRGWRAFLSTTGEGAVNAIERIGAGPWYNSKGELIASSHADLIDAQKLTKLSVVNEKSAIITGREDAINRHDILTGTQNDGSALDNGEDTTCSNWTSNGEGSALAGHHDRIGGGADPTSWTHAHGTRGCSQANLQTTGGDGLFYCFASQLTTSQSRLDSLVPAPAGAGVSLQPAGMSVRKRILLILLGLLFAGLGIFILRRKFLRR